MTLNMLLTAGTFSIIDIAATISILAHGNDWDHVLNSLRDKDFSTTGFDFFLISLLRCSLLVGGMIGVVCNPHGALKKFEAMSSYVSSFAIGIVLYLLSKLLIYSEQPEFLDANPLVMWFWISFGWSIVATTVATILFSKLSAVGRVSLNNTVDVSESSVTENTPLLNPDGTSINDPNAATSKDADSNSSTTSTSGYSDNESNHSEGKKKGGGKKKKTFSELANKVTIMKMLSYSKEDFWLILFAIVFLLGAAIAETFIPLFTGKVISGIAIEHDSAKFTKNIIIMALITIAASLCAGARGGMMSLAISRFNMRIRNHLFHALTKQEIGFFDTTKTGDVISRLTSDTSTMSDMIGLNCNIFLRSVVKGAGTCVFMFSLSWRLSIVTFMGLPLVIGMSKLYGAYYKKLQTKVQDAYAAANEVAEEVVSSMPTVRSFANEIGENNRYKDKMFSVYNVQKKQALAYAGFMLSTEISVLALVTGTLGYGGHLVLGHLMESQNLITFILYQITLGGCMTNISSVYTGLMQALGAAEKVFKLINREPKIELNKGDLVPGEFEGRLAFENVTFSYPSRPKQPVLKNVSFEAPPGQVTALVGPSGGGKSTCVNLLQYFYECNSGCIRIDGNPVDMYCHKYLHQKISLVGQEPVLYARSIKENIAYGLEEHEFAMADVVDAARKANAHSFITELAEQYETETGEKGTQLSGGQKQRVAIARALIRNPRILILDEATSALDTESEYLVQQALQETMKDRTVVVIAHRLSTVEKADKIVVIDKGEVAEEGTHAQLMKNSGMYYNLVHRQLHSRSHPKKYHPSPGSSSRRRQTSRNSSESQSLDIPGTSSILSQSFSISSSIDSEKSVLYDTDSDGSDAKSRSLKI